MRRAFYIFIEAQQKWIKRKLYFYQYSQL
jgi:hypothetical protein